MSGLKSSCGKILASTSLTMLILSQAVLSQAATLHDDFEDGSLDSGLWSVHHPFSDSSAIEGSGVVTIRNRGGLLTQSGFSDAITISGRFSFTGNNHDLFSFVTRTTGTVLYPWGTFSNGIRFNWLKMTDAGQVVNIVSIDQIDGGNPGNDTNLALTNFNFSYNQYYDFKIIDDGANIALYFDDMQTPLLTASDANHPGNQVGFYNREGSGGGSTISDGSEVQMDYIDVQNAIPEPATRSLFALGAVTLLGACRMHRPQSHHKGRSLVANLS